MVSEVLLAGVLVWVGGIDGEVDERGLSATWVCSASLGAAVVAEGGRPARVDRDEPPRCDASVVSGEDEPLAPGAGLSPAVSSEGSDRVPATCSRFAVVPLGLECPWKMPYIINPMTEKITKVPPASVALRPCRPQRPSAADCSAAAASCPVRALRREVGSLASAVGVVVPRYGLGASCVSIQQ